MIINFNSLDRAEKPIFTLCNPGSTYNRGYLTNVVCDLCDHEAEELILNFNSVSELNMRINYIEHESRSDLMPVRYDNRMYKSVQNRRLIFIENIGYFMITSVEEGFEGNKRYKDIRAQSIEVELQNRMLPFIPDGTYPLWDTDTLPPGVTEDEPPAALARLDQNILSMIVETLPLWTVNHVDDTVRARWRTFQDVDTQLDCLSFLINNVQEAYECIVLFDTINRQINVYDMATYIHQTEIHITREDVVNSIKLTENADDIYTALDVKSDENHTISAINPTGTSVIYDFSHYLSWMSPELSDLVTRWTEEYDDVFDSYYGHSIGYYTLRGQALNVELEIARLNIIMTMYQRCRDNIVAEGNTDLVDEYNDAIIENGGTEDELITIEDQIEETLAAIDELIAECQNLIDIAQEELDGYNASLTNIESSLVAIREQLNMANFFGEYYEELMNYIFEGKYVDDYIVITDIMTYPEKFEQLRILYNRAREQLNKLAVPTQEFSIDTEDFLFAKEFEVWSDSLETGCLIDVEIEQDDVASLFLTSINLNYDDHKLTLTFGNRYNRFDPQALFENTLGQISHSANTLNYIKDVITPMTDGTFNSMQQALLDSRNLTMSAALTSTGEEVLIDGSGYTGRRVLESGAFDPRQVKITGRSLVFTDDAWQSCKVALGELLFPDESSAYGINAGAIIGDIIVGNQLQIIDADGNDMFSATADGIISQVGRQLEGLSGRITRVEQTADGLVISVQTLENQEIDHVTTTTGYTFDADGLRIQKDGTEMQNLLNESGMYVARNDDMVLTANNQGVDAINLSARQYLVIGANSRFEDYSNGTDNNRTACYLLA